MVSLGSFRPWKRSSNDRIRAFKTASVPRDCFFLSSSKSYISWNSAASSRSQLATRLLVCSRILVSNFVGGLSSEIRRSAGLARAYGSRLWQLTHVVVVSFWPRWAESKLNQDSPRWSRNWAALSLSQCRGLFSPPNAGADEIEASSACRSAKRHACRLAIVTTPAA